MGLEVRVPVLPEFLTEELRLQLVHRYGTTLADREQSQEPLLLGVETAPAAIDVEITDEADVRSGGHAPQPGTDATF